MAHALGELHRDGDAVPAGSSEGTGCEGARPSAVPVSSAATPGRCLIRRCSSGCGVGDGNESRYGCGASDVTGCCDESRSWR